MNCLDLPSFTLNYLKSPWIILNDLKLQLNTLNYLNDLDLSWFSWLSWFTLNYLELPWIALNYLELSCIALNCLESHWIIFKSFAKFHISIFVTQWVTWQILEMLTHLKIYNQNKIDIEFPLYIRNYLCISKNGWPGHNICRKTLKLLLVLSLVYTQ